MGKLRPVRRLQLPPYAVPPDQARDEAPRHGAWTRHHMVPRSQGGQTTRTNLLEVPDKAHRSYHYLFANAKPEQVIALIAAHWAPIGYFDFLIIRQGNREVRLTRDDLVRMADQMPAVVNAPQFTRPRDPRVRQVYRRRRRRR